MVICTWIDNETIFVRPKRLRKWAIDSLHQVAGMVLPRLHLKELSLPRNTKIVAQVIFLDRLEFPPSKMIIPRSDLVESIAPVGIIGPQVRIVT